METDMPLYILCSQCGRVPVTKINELCENCERNRIQRQQRSDAKILRIYRWLTRKPSRAAQERKAGLK